MTKLPYQLAMPVDHSSSVIFASPHSGRIYPASFLRSSVLDERIIRTSEDAFVDLLFEEVPKLGSPLLSASVPRAYLDLNRNADELDAALIEDMETKIHNPRVASGLGVVPRVVANGRGIYRGKISLKEAHRRISEVWRPYHDCLQSLMKQNISEFGESILIDCHSMPHEAIESIHHAGKPHPDVVLGDRFGVAANSDFVDQIEAAFSKAGLRVAHNSPFAGAFIVQHYGRPSRNQHAVQIEIDRSLYMNEKVIRPNGNFIAFRKLMSQVAADIIDTGRKKVSLAAE